MFVAKSRLMVPTSAFLGSVAEASPPAERPGVYERLGEAPSEREDFFDRHELSDDLDFIGRKFQAFSYLISRDEHPGQMEFSLNSSGLEDLDAELALQVGFSTFADVRFWDSVCSVAYSLLGERHSGLSSGFDGVLPPAVTLYLGDSGNFYDISVSGVSRGIAFRASFLCPAGFDVGRVGEESYRLGVDVGGVDAGPGVLSSYCSVTFGSFAGFDVGLDFRVSGLGVRLGLANGDVLRRLLGKDQGLSFMVTYAHQG